MFVYVGRFWQNVCVGMCWYVLVGKGLNFGVILSVIRDLAMEHDFFNKSMNCIPIYCIVVKCLCLGLNVLF